MRTFISIRNEIINKRLFHYLQLTTLNANDTLQQLNLCPQETVTLEER